MPLYFHCCQWIRLDAASQVAQQSHPVLLFPAVYAAQAQVLATKYLGQAQEVLAPYLEKAGVKTGKKTEL